VILTIWRHGTAAEGTNDRLRELTDAGRDDVGFGSQRFHEACIANKIPHPQAILHSPLVRTTQTAEVIAAAFTHASVRAVPALQPGNKPSTVDEELSRFVDSRLQQQHIVLVSHQPLVSQLVGYYLGGSGSVPFLIPGGLVSLSLDVLVPACASLLFWALPPAFEARV
jgi:phosphohistidine phosphatase